MKKQKVTSKMKDKIKKSQEKKEKLNKLEIDNLLNADYQRLARGEKKAFLSTQCKDTEENSRWEKLEISSREIPREYFIQRWAQSRKKMVWT